MRRNWAGVLPTHIGNKKITFYVLFLRLARAYNRPIGRGKAPAGQNLTNTKKGFNTMCNQLTGYQITKLAAEKAEQHGWDVVQISTSQSAQVAIITSYRPNKYMPDQCYITHEFNPGANHLYWGHYDLTKERAAADHAQRFARYAEVLGGQS